MNIRDGYILKQRQGTDGYSRIGLYNNIGGRSIKIFLVHKLVADAFLNNPDNKPCITHIDKNNLNNCADNLKYASRREIQLHTSKNKTLKKKNMKKKPSVRPNNEKKLKKKLGRTFKKIIWK